MNKLPYDAKTKIDAVKAVDSGENAYEVANRVGCTLETLKDWYSTYTYRKDCVEYWVQKDKNRNYARQLKALRGEIVYVTCPTCGKRSQVRSNQPV